LRILDASYYRGNGRDESCIAFAPIRSASAQPASGFLGPGRAHFHLLDGGLADNIGARTIFQAVTSTDRLVQREGQSNDPVLGGWSLMAGGNNARFKAVLIIVVDVKTKHDTDVAEVRPQ
jgi:hypothetical protein